MNVNIIVMLFVVGLKSTECGHMCYVPCDEWCPHLNSSGSRHNHTSVELSGTAAGNSFNFSKMSKIQDGDEAARQNAFSEIPLDGRNCTGLFSKCNRSEDCCTRHCLPPVNVCIYLPLHQEQRPKCLQMNNQCLFNYECCSDWCDPATGLCLDKGPHTSSSSSEESCSSDKGPCQVDSHCCSNYCDATTGICRGSTEGENRQYQQILAKSAKCLPVNSKCAFQDECCSGLCDVTTGLCLVRREPPSHTSTSSKEEACSPDRGSCQEDSHCCSKLCDVSSGVCRRLNVTKSRHDKDLLPPVKCLREKSQCNSSADCCLDRCDSATGLCAAHSSKANTTTHDASMRRCLRDNRSAGSSSSNLDAAAYTAITAYLVAAAVFIFKI